MIAREIAHGLRVVFKTIAAACGKLTGDVDDKLTHCQQREEHIVVKREITVQCFTTSYPRLQHFEMVEVPAQFSEPFY